MEKRCIKVKMSDDVVIYVSDYNPSIGITWTVCDTLIMQFDSKDDATNFIMEHMQETDLPNGVKKIWIGIVGSDEPDYVDSYDRAMKGI